MVGKIDAHHPGGAALDNGRPDRLAEALPAFTVSSAAVLGVVNTMGSVGQPPAVLGGMIRSAWWMHLSGHFAGLWRGGAAGRPAGTKERGRWRRSLPASETRCWPACGTQPATAMSLAAGAVLRRPAQLLGAGETTSEGRSKRGLAPWPRKAPAHHHQAHQKGVHAARGATPGRLRTPTS